MAHDLPGLTDGTGKADAVYEVVQTALQVLEQRHAGHLRALLGDLEVTGELTLQNPVIGFDLLLLQQLEPILRDLLSAPHGLFGIHPLHGLGMTADIDSQMTAQLKTRLSSGCHKDTPSSN